MNPCPSEGTYCDLSLNYETCIVHSTEAHCSHRVRAYSQEKTCGTCKAGSYDFTLDSYLCQHSLGYHPKGYECDCKALYRARRGQRSGGNADK